jgi:digeranylgeranylglycerophospholipid reductase
MKNKKIGIVGGGPVGFYLSYLLKKANCNVTIFEEHKKVGVPVQCTGIITGEIDKFTDLKTILKKSKLLEIKDVEVFAPNNNSVNIQLRKKNIIIDRAKFDNEIYKLAKKVGVDIRLETKVIKIDIKKIESQNNSINKTKIEYFDYIIGADGPNSIVSQMIHLNNKKKYWVGAQARVKLKNNLSVKFYPFKGTYAWVVPENKKIVRVGVVAEKNVSKQFTSFLKQFVKKKDILEYQGGLIPKFNPFSKYSKKGYYVVGDAGGFVKATTGGGIIPGLESARLLAQSIIHKKNYKRLIIQKLMPNLLIHNIIRNRLDKFSKKDYNELIKIVKEKEIKELIEKYDREFPFKLLVLLLIKKPNLLKFLF